MAATDAAGAPGGKGAARATLLFDGGCASCRKFAGLVRRLDVRRRVTQLSMYDPAVEGRWRPLVGARYDGSFHLVLEPGGRIVSGENALEDLARILSLPGADALFKVPGARGAAASVYRAFAAGRTCQSDAAARASKD
jgi:predicted DCC family thiol-disulfide oxidoreductase YuxK